MLHVPFGLEGLFFVVSPLPGCHQTCSWVSTWVPHSCIIWHDTINSLVILFCSSKSSNCCFMLILLEYRAHTMEFKNFRRKHINQNKDLLFYSKQILLHRMIEITLEGLRTDLLTSRAGLVQIKKSSILNQYFVYIINTK